MTVETEQSSIVFTGIADGVALNVPFPVQATTEVKVRYGATDTLATLGTHYTVALVPPEYLTATVTPMTGFAATSGGTVSVRREVPYTQPTDIPTLVTLASSRLEQMFDRIVFIAQQLRDALVYSLKFPTTDQAANIGLLPVASERASKYLGFDTAGKPIAVASAASTTGFTAFGIAWGQLLDAAAGRSNLSVYSTTQVDALDTAVTAASVPKSLLTTIGDIIYGSAVSTAARLGIGSTGQVLTVAAGLPSWATPLVYAAGVRQTVQHGPVTTAGLPDFLPATDANLDLGSQNISSSYPLVVSAANGSSGVGPVNLVGISTANLTWTGLTASRAAATPNFLYVTISAAGVLTPGSTIVAPVYQWGGTPAVTAGLYTYNISEMRGYLGNGSTAPQTNLVFVGEAATDGTGVISTVAYAYNGQYDSGWTATLPTAATVVSKNCNLGVTPEYFDARFIVQNTTTEGGYAVGDTIDDVNYNTSTSVFGKMTVSKTRNTVRTTPGNQSTGIMLVNLSNGAALQLTAASWKYKFTANRGW